MLLGRVGQVGSGCAGQGMLKCKILAVAARHSALEGGDGKGRPRCMISNAHLSQGQLRVLRADQENNTCMGVTYREYNV